MESLDNWRAFNEKIEDDLIGECLMCGKALEEGKDYCSRDCIKASWL